MLEQIVTTIASVADTAQTTSLNTTTSSCLAEVHDRERQHPDHRMLRGKTIECVSLMVSLSAQFAADASEVMELLLSSQVKGEELRRRRPADVLHDLSLGSNL